MSNTTTNMSLTSWTATDKFDYTELANNWNKIDAHDHTSTKGKQIPTAGIQTSAITTALIADGAVTTNKLNFDAVSSYRKNYLFPKTQSYSTGTITLASTGVVTGAGGATFDSSMVGAILTVTGTSKTYKITDYTNSTTITVSNPNSDTAAAGSAYSIAYTLADGALATVDAYADSKSAIAIASASVSGSTVTYTTSSNHGLVTGQQVTIIGSVDSNYNGTNLPITVASGTPTQFTVPTTASGYSSTPTGSTTLGLITMVRSIGYQTFRYSSSDAEWHFVGGTSMSLRNSAFQRTSATNAVTAVAAGTYNGVSTTGYAEYTATGHAYLPGQTITVSGASVSGYNGTFTILATQTNKFTVSNATTGAATFTSGLATPVIGTSYAALGSINIPYKGVYNITLSEKMYTGGSATVVPAITATASGNYLGTAATGYATYTLGSTTAHGLSVGQTVTISGITAASGSTGWNGTFVIVATDTYRFTVASSVAAMTTPSYTSSSVTYTPNNTLYLCAATSGAATDALAIVQSGVGATSDVSQNRTVTIAADNTTYYIYAKASSITGGPTMTNGSFSATPVTLFTTP